MDTAQDKAPQQVERRKHKRYNVPAMITCTFFEGGITGKTSFQGYIRDISLGGVSIEIRDDFSKISEALLCYTTVHMNMVLNFPDGEHKMDFSGIIRWCTRKKEKSRNFLYVGIKFNNLSEENQALVRQYMSLGQGDKNLIWNLWDHLSSHV